MCGGAVDARGGVELMHGVLAETLVEHVTFL